MLHFCTLFDANYLARGLVTYESLMSATEGAAHLYVFAFDDKCYNVLTSMQLPNLTVISLAEFEDEQLFAWRILLDLHEFDDSILYRKIQFAALYIH